MRFHLSLITVLVAFVHGTVSATDNFTLYAYGKGLQSGLQLVYGDGQAYIGLKLPSFAVQATNIKLSLTDDAKLIATPDSTASWSSEPSLYIGADDGDLKKIGFSAGNETIPDGAIVAGFGLFGGWAYNSEHAGAIEMKFVASPTNETDVYQVKWNVAGTKVTGGDIPISLRTEAPAVPED
ncbi:hypothetical protein BKA66DRAFT_607726 [Pyrenochaeta sp. MPI-SDFR-AT-0127]|nr:hypothetical protein BKA66DRAFT_607726 [Pyrenochaeta sp. MPI-SDFR-AT-0127]